MASWTLKPWVGMDAYRAFLEKANDLDDTKPGWAWSKTYTQTPALKNLPSCSISSIEELVFADTRVVGASNSEIAICFIEREAPFKRFLTKITPGQFNDFVRVQMVEATKDMEAEAKAARGTEAGIKFGIFAATFWALFFLGSKIGHGQ